MVIPTLTEVQKIEGPPQGQWTCKDLDKLRQGRNRYEIIDGVLYVSVASPTFHGYLIKQLCKFFSDPIWREKSGFGLTDFGYEVSEKTSVFPDFILTNYDVEASMAGEPKRARRLIAEVLATQNSDYDESIKLTAYAKAGVPEYIVIDAWKKQLRLYSQPMEGEYRQLKKFNAGDTTRFAAAPEIELAVGDLFMGSPDETL